MAVVSYQPATGEVDLTANQRSEPVTLNGHTDRMIIIPQDRVETSLIMLFGFPRRKLNFAIREFEK